jgi:DNA-binding MarR family transcriptional regulator
MTPARTLGTLLRNLSETLDRAVEDAYRDAGLRYRPRYTPVYRALLSGPASIRALSRETGVSHSAVSQTVAQMKRDGLVALRQGADARERIVELSPAALALRQKLERHWEVTEAATQSLERDVGAPIGELLKRALAALEDRSMGQRIADAQARQPAPEE